MRDRLKIVFYGDADQPGSGGARYVAALEGLGHDVHCVSSGARLERYGEGYLHRGVQKVLGRPLERDRRRHVEELVSTAAAERPDIVIVLKGVHISAAEVRGLQAGGAWVANINHDDFFSLNPRNWSVTQRQAISHYDFIFATREVNVAEVRPINPCVEFFPFAYDPAVHRPVAIEERERRLWSTDVVFVGTWERERAALLETLVSEVPARYAVWGNSWDRLRRGSPLRPFVRRRPVFMDDMAKALGGAKVALAFLRKLNRDEYTQRSFEIPACGGVLLAERTPMHERLYTEGVEAELFDARKPTELVEKVRRLLSDDAHRERLRAAGRARLLQGHHTYRDRIQRLLEVFEQQARIRQVGASP